MRVSYSLCENCVIDGNGRDGLSIGHQDTDAIICRNRISANGRHGIYIRNDSAGRSGDRTIIMQNEFCENCCVMSAGEIYFDASATDMHIVNNMFQTVERSEQNKLAIFFNTKSNHIFMHNNKTVNCELVKSAKDEYIEGISFDAPERSLAIELNQVPPEAVRHLRGCP